MNKIAFISLMSGSPWGGSEELWASTAEEALDNGCKVLISVVDWGEIPAKVKELANKGAHIHLRKQKSSPKSVTGRIFNKIKKEFSIYKENTFRHIEDFHPDMICVNQGGCFNFLYTEEFMSYIKKTAIPYFLVCQYNSESGILSNVERLASKEIYMNAKHAFFVSERNRTTCRRQLISDLKNSSVVFNPINILLPEYIPYPTSVSVHFASVARLDCNYKGQDILFQVLSGSVWKDRNWTLNIYGTGKDKEYLKELASYFGISGNVFFHDFISDIKDVWRINQLLLMPSVGEGTPLSLVEGMICGRAAIGTDVGDIAEFISEGSTGYLAEGPSVKYFGAALERAWKEKEIWQQLGKNAHAFAKKRIDLNPGKTLMEKMVRLYNTSKIL